MTRLERQRQRWFLKPDVLAIHPIKMMPRKSAKEYRYPGSVGTVCHREQDKCLARLHAGRCHGVGCVFV